jgi:polysaccharide biosynthesis protein PslH
MSKPGDDSSAALLLAAERPYPTVGGGAIRTASLAEYLGRHYQLDAIVFRQPDDSDPASSFPPGLARRVEVIDLPRHSKSIGARAWRNAGRYSRGVPPLNDRYSGFEKQVATLTEGRRYAIAVVEHFWCAPYASQLERCCDHLVLDLHNIESRLYQTFADADGVLQGIVFKRFARAALMMEQRWLPRYSTLLTASEEDAQHVRSKAPAARTIIYPNTLPLTDAPSTQPDNTIVFSGNLEYRPNTSAVRFFHDRIWPLIRARRSGLHWRVVGKNPGGLGKMLDGDPRIEVVGPVDDALAELAHSKIAVVPLLSGSGTRVKIIEAWAAGVPVVSTTLGAEGLGAVDGTHVMLADSPE